MNGVGKRDEELHLALGAGVLINAESLEALDALLAGARPPGARIGLRLNPALDAATHPHLATGAAISKFGIPLAALPQALAAVDAAGRTIESLGAHIGSGGAAVEPTRSLPAMLAPLAGATRPSEWVDLGGGLAWDPGGLGIDAVRPHLPDASRLILEPGRRWSAAPAGCSPASSGFSRADTWWPMPA